ncbi:MAG TPA: DNA-binding domain-containing protein [Nitrospira sp.]|nr:DNA-binding domain-containing protein [Nitrospira sp.]
MLRLREIQEVFAEGMTAGSYRAMADALPSDGSALRSVALYRRLIRTNYTQVLRITYPLLARLVGERFFSLCARGYHARYPSTSGDLFAYGRHFPQWLLELDGVRLLVQLARLEWACHEVHQADDTRAPAVERAEAGAWADPSSVRFRVNRATRLLACTVPIYRVWHALQADTDGGGYDGGAEPNPVPEETGLLVVRAAGTVQVVGLSPEQFLLLHAMRDGKTVAQVERMAAELVPADQGASLLAMLLEEPTRSAFSLEVDP